MGYQFGAGCVALGFGAMVLAGCGSDRASASAIVIPPSSTEAELVVSPEPEEPAPLTREELKAQQDVLIDEALAAAAETDGPGSPAMWVLSDRDSTIYLFGSVHILRPSTKWFSGAIKDAFDGSDMLVMETNTDTPAGDAEAARLVRHYGRFPVGRTLLDYTEEEDEPALKRLAEELDMPFDEMVMFKPWLLTESLSGENVGTDRFKRSYGVEGVLTKHAVEASKSFGYLESPDDQISVISRGSVSEQLDELLTTFETREDRPELLDTMVAEWVDGDVDGLGLIVAQPGLWGSDAYHEAILANRNRNWIPKLKIILGIPGDTFVAVGAAHLAGPDSVVEMLRAEGYEVERVEP